MTVSLKYFKACIFQTIGPIFMKVLPSIMVCKILSAKVTLFCVYFPLRSLLHIISTKISCAGAFTILGALLLVPTDNS